MKVDILSTLSLYLNRPIIYRLSRIITLNGHLERMIALRNLRIHGRFLADVKVNVLGKSMDIRDFEIMDGIVYNNKPEFIDIDLSYVKSVSKWYTIMIYDNKIWIYTYDSKTLVNAISTMMIKYSNNKIDCSIYNLIFYDDYNMRFFIKQCGKFLIFGNKYNLKYRVKK